MARPRVKIDAAQVQNLAAIGCTMNEIAAVFGCSVDTLERRFADIIKRGRAECKSSLRRMQWKSAEGGSVTMQIWLGKQMLKQRDNPEEEQEPQEDAGLEAALDTATTDAWADE